MSRNESELLFWLKGSFIRKKIMEEIYISKTNNLPIFVSKLELLLKDKLLEKKPSKSTVRKEVKILLEHNYLMVINKKGKPKYLSLTGLGEKFVSLMILKKELELSKK